MTDAPHEADSLTEADLDRLAALHARCLPTSLPARLGESYLRRLYRYIAVSRHEIVQPLRRDSRIVAAAILSVRPDSLSRRLLLHTPLIAFLPLLAIRMLTTKARPDGKSSGTPTLPRMPEGPELVWIFVDEAMRGASLGGRLLELLEAKLAAMGLSSFLVRTFADPDHAAGRFYLGHGFADAGTCLERGTLYRILRRDIPAAQTQGDR